MGDAVASSERRAYEAIRRGILAGDWPGGQHLGAADLAHQLGISRTPVREALRRLAAEGLIEAFANRGAFVAEISAGDIDEVFEIRALLESHAAARAATRLAEADIAALAASTECMEAAAGPVRDLALLTRANEAFHAAIIAAAANRRLGRLIASVVRLSWVARTFSIYAPADLQRSIAHHREMIAAFRARDAAWAGAVMQSHIRAARDVFRAAGGCVPTHRSNPDE
jgi:DNA-binding GntR family transcriptional regulator